MQLYPRVVAAAVALGASLLPDMAAAQRVSGKGQQATAMFPLSSGLTIFELEHRGEGDFVVRLLDDRGVLIDTLARAVGAFRGSKAIHLPRSGSYLYDVHSRGEWTIGPRVQPGTMADSVIGSPSPAGVLVASAPPAAATSLMIQQAGVDAEDVARRKGSFPWLLGGLGGGVVLGPVGAGLVFVAANKRENPRQADVDARRAAHGPAYADAFASAYQRRRRSDRRVAALIGGATGTAVFGFVIAQILNLNNKSGGSSGPPGGELP